MKSDETASLSSSSCCIVYLNNLLSLFRFCPSCGARTSAEQVSIRFIGSMACVKVLCDTECNITWKSQPKLGKLPLGNLAMTCGAVFSGSTYTTLSNIAEAMDLKIIGRTQFYDIQQNYLHPVVQETFEEHISQVQHHVKQNPVVLTGDGR